MENPFHVAIPWPRGIELLLQLGGESGEGVLNAPNAFGESPLDYALQLGQLSSVELLVKANAEIDLESTINIETTKERFMHCPQIDEIIDFLCRTLAERRKRMLWHAREWLSRHEIARLGLEDQDMLQETAFDIAESLRHQSDHLSSWFRKVQPASIYYSAFLSMNLVRALLRVGFRNPNTTFHGFTPLMTVNLRLLRSRRRLEGTVDLVTWFIGQGENLHASIPVSALTGIPNQLVTPCLDFKIVHRLADAYGEGLHHSRITAEDELRLGHLSGIINDASMDPCICYCSLKGCTPSTLFMRSFFNEFRFLEMNHLEGRNKGVALMSIFLSKYQAHDLVVDAIRVSTFQRLGMKHTCCNYERKGWRTVKDGVTHAILAGKYKIIDIMDPEEVAEVQEEDQHLALRLEALVEEFTAKYDEQKTSFHDFFFGYWWQRMDEVEEEEEEICKDDLKDIQDIGVVLDQSE